MDNIDNSPSLEQAPTELDVVRAIKLEKEYSRKKSLAYQQVYPPQVVGEVEYDADVAWNIKLALYDTRVADAQLMLVKIDDM
jgi:hypothetical protein